MKITCALENFNFSKINSDLDVILFEYTQDKSKGCIGAKILRDVYESKLIPHEKAWDLVSIALSVIAADQAGHRKKSPDGWTRNFELTISVIDSIFWNKQKKLLETLLSFLTTDRWELNFVGGGEYPKLHKDAFYQLEDCVSLLSGGLDSFIGVIDLVEQNYKPYVVTQTVRGDGKNQQNFAKKLGNLAQFMTNHNVKVPFPETPASQRSRSIIFLAYGVLIASSLDMHRQNETVTLYVCENGYISINPPITLARVGSLSTRTTHPVVLNLFQQILDNCGLNILICNPYKFVTKGEMLEQCLDQSILENLAHTTTSCGRYGVYKNTHCGRCIPCLVRRASFFYWKGKDYDQTEYKFDDLSQNNQNYARFDDVFSMQIAILNRQQLGTSKWIGASLSSNLIPNQDKQKHQDTVERGLLEMQNFMADLGLV
ncbi:hypothetical protein MW335_002626 [Acinetobacter baumannii]|uniref:Qat anti-phage system QueC-like protein QatC n=2 Tax=Acinetobacter baumannii TaxID=470 RepID=UPI000F9A3408|nr:Qat anti-phage system QueC-like protein QatC [Acinetobacter baumannii]EJB8412391.1 hypothetical protein [Acinetobacter baumannii]MDC5191803.1 hypothetical protein [Acinetobacter baumannii]MDC5568744.1 hypothetical protein [Acinetobacter baumannii]MDO7201755.1 Qat anti-phage system QueC-like protein QatC [Acinetobacter baumannii]RUT40278.1 hypothetical protein EM030_13640 [Acinetobacter baumannii]